MPHLGIHCKEKHRLSFVKDTGSTVWYDWWTSTWPSDPQLLLQEVLAVQLDRLPRVPRALQVVASGRCWKRPLGCWGTCALPRTIYPIWCSMVYRLFVYLFRSLSFEMTSSCIILIFKTMLYFNWSSYIRTLLQFCMSFWIHWR